MNHNTGSTEEISRGVAVEKLDSVKKWGINTYKVDCARIIFRVIKYGTCSYISSSYGSSEFEANI